MRGVDAVPDLAAAQALIARQQAALEQLQRENTVLREKIDALCRKLFGQSSERVSDKQLRLAFAELGQWDHHANEGASTGQIANRLDDFARGIAAFAQDLGDRMADVVLVTMSEFGRTVRENGNRGTDHGHGNAMLILGGPVKGGKVYGKWPGLEREQLWQGRDLAITTDFRDVFAECVTSHLGARDISKVFPGYVYKERLGLL